MVVLLICAFTTGAFRAIGGMVESAALPSVAWLPLSAVAIGGTVWGLRVGFRQHGRGEPLAVGLFGLLVAASGLFFGLPWTLFGMAVVLAAAIWSSVALSRSR
jgi:hypothetical protein